GSRPRRSVSARLHPERHLDERQLTIAHDPRGGGGQRGGMIDHRGMDTRVPSKVIPDRLDTATSTSSSRLAIPTPMTCAMPAARAERMPAQASSNTMHWSGRRPSAAAPARYGSGAGLPDATSSADTTLTGWAMPAEVKRASAMQRRPEVTNAHEPGGQPAMSSGAPRIGGTSVARVNSMSMRSSVAAAACSALTRSATTSRNRSPCRMSRWKSNPGTHRVAHWFHTPAATSWESTRTPSLSKSTPAAGNMRRPPASPPPAELLDAPKPTRTASLCHVPAPCARLSDAPFRVTPRGWMRSEAAVDHDMLDAGELEEAGKRVLGPDTGLAEPADGQVGPEYQMVVDPHGPEIQCILHACSPTNIGGEHRRGQSVSCSVGFGQCIGFIGEGLDGEDGPEDLFGDDLVVLLDADDDGGRKEIAAGVGVGLPAQHHRGRGRQTVDLGNNSSQLRPRIHRSHQCFGV